MILIQFILTGILVVALLFALIRREKSPLIALGIALLSCTGIVFVLVPSLAQDIATDVGVGRGVDLITYVFMAVMLVVIFDVYLRLQAMLEMLTVAVRRITLLEEELEKLKRP